MLTFLSWNLAMMERSDEAPATWRIDQTEAAIRAMALRLDPDIIAFQELPGLVPFIETHEMAPANTRGQSGDIATLIRRELMQDVAAQASEKAVLTTFKSHGLTVANVHLPSGSGGTRARMQAIRHIRDDSPTDDLALIGDTNTRRAEEAQIARYGYAGDRPPQATFNSRENRYRMGGRAFTAYFTRAFVSEGLELGALAVHPARQTSGGNSFCLSDHYALSGTIKPRAAGG